MNALGPRSKRQECRKTRSQEFRSCRSSEASAPRGGEFGALRNWSGIQFLLADCRLLPPVTPELLSSRLLNTRALFHHCVDRWLRRVLGFLARSESHRRGP